MESPAAEPQGVYGITSWEEAKIAMATLQSALTYGDYRNIKDALSYAMTEAGNRGPEQRKLAKLILLNGCPSPIQSEYNDVWNRLAVFLNPDNEAPGWLPTYRGRYDKMYPPNNQDPILCHIDQTHLSLAPDNYPSPGSLPPTPNSQFHNGPATLGSVEYWSPATSAHTPNTSLYPGNQLLHPDSAAQSSHYYSGTRGSNSQTGQSGSGNLFSFSPGAGSDGNRRDSASYRRSQ